MGVPALLGLVCLGCGLALERIADTRLAGALLLPAGFAVLIVLAQALTTSDATAGLTTPVVAGFALAGLVYGRTELRRALTPGLAAALVAYLCYGLPVLATGEAGLTGYIKLDDTATWLAITDQIMANGRNLTGLAPSTFEAALQTYVATGYPVGSFVPLGVAHDLTGTDIAWLFVPVIAFAGGLLALTLFALTEGVIRSVYSRAAVAAVAAQPATLVAYTQWGGMKEIVVAALMPLIVALAWHARAESGPRAILPAAVAVAAMLAALSVGGMVWAAPLVLPAVLAGGLPPLRAAWRGVRWDRAAALLGIVAVCSIPVIQIAKEFLSPLTADGPGAGGVFTSQVETGKLVGSLNPLQIAGIWPVGDFRLDPSRLGSPTRSVILAVLAGWAAVVVAWRAGHRALPFYVVTTIFACLAIVNRTSPWVDAKSLAQASPAIVLAALTAAALLWDRSRRLVAGAVALAVGGGVLWSNALAYREVYLAPRDSLHELEQIGHVAARMGPTLMTDYSPFGARHFLRETAAEGASELRRNSIPLRNGRQLQVGDSTDIDALDPVAVYRYRSLVLRRSPAASRPPSIYRLRWGGKHYELWQRPAEFVPPLEHVAFGDKHNPGAIPRCASVLRVARAAGPHGRVAAVVRHPTATLALGVEPFPAAWRALPGNRERIIAEGPGTMKRSLIVRRPGRFEIWLGGSTRGRTSILVDGRRVASARHRLNYINTSFPIGEVTLGRGVHEVVLKYEEGGLAPGNHGRGINSFVSGPLALSRDDADRPVVTLPASRARELCGQRLDWIEALVL